MTIVSEKITFIEVPKPIECGFCHCCELVNLIGGWSCRAAKGSKRRISKTSQCIKTIHFLGFMHCTPEELVSW